MTEALLLWQEGVSHTHARTESYGTSRSQQGWRREMGEFQAVPDHEQRPWWGWWGKGLPHCKPLKARSWPQCLYPNPRGLAQICWVKSRQDETGQGVGNSPEEANSWGRKNTCGSVWVMRTRRQGSWPPHGSAAGKGLVEGRKSLRTLHGAWLLTCERIPRKVTKHL